MNGVKTITRTLVVLAMVAVVGSAMAFTTAQQNVDPVIPPPQQQNVEPADACASQRRTVAEQEWLQAAKETMSAIGATGRLAKADRDKIAKREKDKSPRELFRLRLAVLQELASR